MGQIYLHTHTPQQLSNCSGCCAKMGGNNKAVYNLDLSLNIDEKRSEKSVTYGSWRGFLGGVDA